MAFVTIEPTIRCVNEDWENTFISRHENKKSKALRSLRASTGTNASRQTSSTSSRRVATKSPSRSIDSRSGQTVRTPRGLPDRYVSKPKTPQFRQSKRWNKAYGLEHASRPRTAPESVDLTRRASLMSDIPESAAASPAKSNQTNMSLQSDEYTCPKAMRHTASASGWQYLRHSRFVQANQILVRSAEGRSPWPRGSDKVISSETNNSPLTQGNLAVVKSKSRRRYALLIKNLHSVMGIKANEDVTTQEKPTSTAFQVAPKTNFQHNVRTKIVSLNSSASDKRCSVDYKNMLGGDQAFTADMEKKLEPSFGEEVLVALEDSSPITSISTMAKADNDKAFDIFRAGPTPPERTSSRSRAATRSILQSRPSREMYRDGSRGRNSDQGVGKSSQALRSHMNEPLPPTVLGGPRQMTKDLKMAKSMDSMARIEAHLNSPVASPRHAPILPLELMLQPQLASSTWNVAPSVVKNSAGEPPERPLPALPGKESLEEGRHTCGQSSISAGRRPRLSSDAAVDIRPPSRLSSIHTLCEIVSEGDGDVLSGSGNPQEAVTATAPTNLATRSYKLISAKISTQPKLKIKDLSTDRSQRICELKKKHIAAIIKRRDILKEAETVENLFPHLNTSIRYSCEKKPDPKVLTTNRVLPIWQPTRFDFMASRATSRTQSQMQLSDDEIPLFPAPPISRTGSRTSQTKSPHRSSPPKTGLADAVHAHSSRTISSRRTRSKTSIAHAHRPSTHHESRPKHRQKLSQSTIMIVCDTDPCTDQFRASARSPIPSITGPETRSSTPSSRRVSPLKPLSPVTHRGTTSIDEVVDLRSFPAINKKHMAHGAEVRVLTTIQSTNNAAMPLATQPLVFPPTFRSPVQQTVLQASDSDSEDVPLANKRPITANSAVKLSSTRQAPTPHPQRDAAREPKGKISCSSSYNATDLDLDGIMRGIIWYKSETDMTRKASSLTTKSDVAAQTTLKKQSQQCLGERMVIGVDLGSIGGTPTLLTMNNDSDQSDCANASDKRTSGTSMTDPADYEPSFDRRPSDVSKGGFRLSSNSIELSAQRRLAAQRIRERILHPPPAVPAPLRIRSSQAYSPSPSTAVSTPTFPLEPKLPGQKVTEVRTPHLCDSVDSGDELSSSYTDDGDDEENRTRVIGTEQMLDGVDAMKEWPMAEARYVNHEVMIEGGDMASGRGRTLRSQFMGL